MRLRAPGAEAVITIYPTGAGYEFEVAGRRCAFASRTDATALHIAMLAIARTPHPVTLAEAREAFRLSAEALPRFQRRWRSRLAETLGHPRACPALAAEIRERLVIGDEVLAFIGDGLFGVPVRVAREILIVPKARRPRRGGIVRYTSPRAHAMRVLTTLCFIHETPAGTVVHEPGEFLDLDPVHDAELIAQQPDWLTPVRAPTDGVDEIDELCLTIQLQGRMRPWPSTHVDG